MKIRTLKWKDHPILGNLALDFQDPQTNETYDTIVIAGENGTGKSTIFDTLCEFLSGGSILPFDFIEYSAAGQVLIAVPTDGKIERNQFYKLILPNGESMEMNIGKHHHNDKDNDDRNIRKYGYAISKARADYKTGPIRSSTTKTLDESNVVDDNNDDFTQLKQLFVDIQEQDNDLKSSWFDWCKNEHKDFYRIPEPEYKMSRFKEAFNDFFKDHGLVFDRCSTDNGEKKIVFKKNGEEIGIDALSTGEKQIVFRGAHLLKNSKMLDGSVVFVDEPELSMHPLWQEKVLKYYKNIFTIQGEQKVQLFIATHSAGVIREALTDKENTKVIILKDNGGHIEPAEIQEPQVLNNTCAAEVNYQAFGIASTDYHNALYGYIEAEGWKNDYEQNKQRVNYNKVQKNGTIIQQQITMSEKIRHIIHHPENDKNTFSSDELKQSIEDMRNFIRQKRGI